MEYGRPFARISGRASTWIEIFELLAGAQLFMSESDGNDIRTSSEHSIISNVTVMRPHFRKLFQSSVTLRPSGSGP